MNDNTFGLMTFEGLSIALVGIVTVMHECTLSMYNCTAHLKMFDQAFTSAYLHKEYFWPKAKERDTFRADQKQGCLINTVVHLHPLRFHGLKDNNTRAGS